ncbi:hypothetical protein MRB53_041493 [Persea americana]|nr:hypothetical protein MRB53_041493 [Persea americana]
MRSTAVLDDQPTSLRHQATVAGWRPSSSCLHCTVMVDCVRPTKLSSSLIKGVFVVSLPVGEQDRALGSSWFEIPTPRLADGTQAANAWRCEKKIYARSNTQPPRSWTNAYCSPYHHRAALQRTVAFGDADMR